MVSSIRQIWHGFTCILVCLVAAFVFWGCTSQKFGIVPESQTFQQQNILNRNVDLVLMIDTSSSMLRHQQDLYDQMPNMLAELKTQGVNFRVASTTADFNQSGAKFIGYPNSVFSSGSDDNILSVLQSRIELGHIGSDLERGLDTIKGSLTASQNLLRADALTVLLFMSDDNDHSADQTSQDFVNFMNSIRAPFPSGMRSWVANYIGTLSTADTCAQSLGSWLGIGTKYLDVVNASHGIASSICSDTLAKAVDDVKVQMLNLLTVVSLDRQPDPATIKVTENGVDVPQSSTNGWQYESAGNDVKFYGTAIPQPNDKVVIDFVPVNPK